MQDPINHMDGPEGSAAPGEGFLQSPSAHTPYLAPGYLWSVPDSVGAV